MWPDDRFRELVGIELPIIQAPMAGSSSTAMAIAVIEAGGLGSLACATLGVAELRSEIAKVLERSAGCGFSKSIRYGIIEFFVPAFD